MHSQRCVSKETHETGPGLMEKLQTEINRCYWKRDAAPGGQPLRGQPVTGNRKNWVPSPALWPRSRSTSLLTEPEKEQLAKQKGAVSAPHRTRKGTGS